MSNNFDDLPYISVPPETLEIFKALKNSVPPGFLEDSQKMIQSFGPAFQEAQALAFSPSFKMAQEVAKSVPPEVIETAQVINKFFNQNRASIMALSKIATRFSKAVNEEENTQIAEKIFTQNSSKPLSDTLDEVERGLVAVQKVDWDEVDRLEDQDEVPSAITKPFEGIPAYEQAKDSLGCKFKKVTKQVLIKIPIFLQTTIQTLLPYAIPLYTHWDNVKRSEIASEVTKVQSDKLIETMETNNRFQERQIELSEQLIKNQKIIINNQEILISQDEETRQVDNVNSQDNYNENQNN